MKKAGYIIFVVFNYIITLLPFKVLYLISDIFFLLLYHVVKYRRSVVENNLKRAFPEKSPEELKKIGRRVYRHLSDIFIDTLKPIHMSPQQINRRFTVTDTSLVDRFFEEGRDVVALSSHYNNWEWLSALQLSALHQVITIYKPLKNKDFDRFMLKIRTKFGMRVSPMNHILRDLVNCRNENIRTMSGFVADQTPPRDDNAMWTTFLNQDTGFFRGAEKVAVKYDMPVVFMHIRKIKRGFYELEYRLITEHPREEEPNFIISRYVSMLEEVIRSKPEYWLWSHRRWKYKRPQTK
ncbi:MAG: lysophospholipid acyltransferase family protein [Bacteroidales bacterium]|jgi:KDO2-lipid IV(A) lauroyltransferase|nr:lysophospholipid acyltransferase family protein [Bacteroidales bacterium]